MDESQKQSAVLCAFWRLTERASPRNSSTVGRLALHGSARTAFSELQYVSSSMQSTLITFDNTCRPNVVELTTRKHAIVQQELWQKVSGRRERVGRVERGFSEASRRISFQCMRTTAAVHLINSSCWSVQALDAYGLKRLEQNLPPSIHVPHW